MRGMVVGEGGRSAGVLLYNESVHRKKQHTRGNNTIPYKLATLVTFETLKWKYTFATNVLIVTRDESPLVYRALEASEDSHFGTFHIGTSTIRDCTTALFQVTMYRQFARKVSTQGWTTNCNYLLGSRASDLENLLALLNEEPCKIRHQWQHITHQVLTTCIVTRML